MSTNPRQNVEDCKAAIQAELPLLDREAEHYGTSYSMQRAEQLRDELVWIDRWLKRNADKYPAPLAGPDYVVCGGVGPGEPLTAEERQQIPRLK